MKAVLCLMQTQPGVGWTKARPTGAGVSQDEPYNTKMQHVGPPPARTFKGPYGHERALGTWTVQLIFYPLVLLMCFMEQS